MHRILLVEDSADYQALIQRALSDGPYSLCVAPTLAAAKTFLAEQDFALVLLDVTLPDGDGFGFCASLRQEAKTRSVPVVFLTGKADISEKVLGFSLGADDYIQKPFHPLELKARVHARLKAAEALAERGDSFHLGNLQISLAQQQAFIVDSNSKDGGKTDPLDLTPVQFKLLVYLARHEERVFSREQLMNAIRGENIHVSDRTMDTHISNLRKKIALSDYSIRTVYGVGYSFSRAQTTKKKAA